MKLINADCIEAMKAMPDNSVDSIVTDPPYELGFMGKSWDASGIAFNIEVWQEALRVIKPGGHLIAFSGSRTYHRMAVAIEDAGFQIRDQIMWVYGSGFPKSHNISKGIDKAAGVEREVVGQTTKARSTSGKSALPTVGGQTVYETWNETTASTPEAKQWDGWGTALKPAHEPMVLARKPLEGTVANNVLTHGVGGLNIDGSRVPSPDNDGKVWTRGGNGVNARSGSKDAQDNPQLNGESELVQPNELGRFPANFIHDGSDEVVALFPNTNKSRSALMGKGGDDKGNSIYGKYADIATVRGHDDNGGSAARFFYCAKASKRDRNEGLDGFEAKRDHDGRKDGGVGGDNPRNCTNNAKLNHHPTVKPTSLMQYLVRLVTPPNGIVLDPFMGSGSTGKACAYEGFEFIGIDQSAEYVEIAQARIDFALADKSDELPL
jgi:site-specific DNA-methyltransferase (adenine-specific)